MKILRYTDKIQKAFACNVKPEPWLHCGITREFVDNSILTLRVWVWDTRKLVGGAIIENGNDTSIQQIIKSAKRANDNHQPLLGMGANAANRYLGFTNSK